MTGRDITDADYAAALEAGRRAAASEFRAEAICYLAGHDAIEVITAGSGGFVIPWRLIGVLQDVPAANLAGMELWLDGSVIESLDIHISVDGMVKAALPVLVPARIVAGLFAAQGGAARSEAKASSSRKNGKKGGRPKKVA